MGEIGGKVESWGSNPAFKTLPHSLTGTGRMALSFSQDGLTCFSESGIAIDGLLPQPISPTPQSNLHRSFLNALQCFAPFSRHLWNWFSVCTRGEIEMCVGRRIMLTLFSLCYIALASRCQRENFTYFHKREKTIHRDFIRQPIRIRNSCTKTPDRSSVCGRCASHWGSTSVPW